MTAELDDAEIAAAEGRNRAWLLSGTCPCACCSRLPRATPRTTPGAMDPPEGSVTPAPSSKQPRYIPPQYRTLPLWPHSPACGRNGIVGRPRIDPEVKRATHNAAQNARRAAKRSADLYTCQDCHGPTGRRAGALRCYRCDRAHKCVVRNANRAARKAEAGK